MNIKKAVILGTLGAILVGLCSFAFSKYAPKTTTPVIKPVYANEVETANGTWYFNDKIIDNITQRTTYLINFKYITAQTTCTKLIVETSPSIGYIDGINPARAAYYNERWANNNYRTINITGGTSTTDPLFIEWLNQNATKLPKNCICCPFWYNHEITAESAYGNYEINFYSNGFKYNSLKIGYYANSVDTPTATQNAFMFNNSYNIYNNGTWQHERQWSRLTITDGTDVTNYALISWLYQNGQQMQFISNPINTKWTFENAINTISISDNIYNIQFTTGREQAFFMRVGRNTNTIDYAIKTNDANVYTLENVYNTYWLNPKYQTIIITGNDTIMNNAVSDQFLIISFFQSNANGTSYTPIPTNPNDYDIENGNFVSIQSLMLRILTMPFTFIVQAFNVTLWPNTAWEFNIGNFILAIIAISAILFIIKVFTSGFSVIGNYNNSRNQNKLTKSQIETNKSRAELNKARTEKVKKETK